MLLVICGARSETKAKTSDLEVAQPELKHESSQKQGREHQHGDYVSGGNLRTSRHQSSVLEPQSLRQYASPEPQNQSPSLAELGKQASTRPTRLCRCL